MAERVPFTPYQKFVLALLAFLQFTIILDFMIMSPLGALLMPALKIGPTEFGLVVSAYAFSAGVSGFLAAGFADRFDRKRLLLFFYAGFVLGTLLCGLATSYYFLLAARIVTGLFGGVIGSIVLAITTDLFSYQNRGRVMGVLQTAFAGSQVLGLPIGLYLSNYFGWHFPFLMIVGIATIVGFIIAIKLQPVDAHLKDRIHHHPLRHLANTLTNSRFLLAYLTTGLLSLGGFMLMPFGSAFSVHNMGLTMEQLPLIYMVTGVTAILTGPLVGRMADLYGKYKVFLFGAATTIVMVMIYTHRGVTPLYLAMLINALLFVGIFSRMIPSQALMSALPEPAQRGSFMAVNSSLQQLAGGLASIIAGLIVKEGPGGRIEHFDTVGYILVCTVLITSLNMFYIQKSAQNHLAKAS